MKGYYDNPELRLSSITIFMLMILFMVINLFSLKVNNENLKNSYVNTLGIVVGTVVDKHPEMEQDIIPIITKAENNINLERGRAILKDYGLTKNLETALFPYVNKAVSRNNIVVFSVWVIMLAIFMGFNYFQYKVIYKRVKEVTLSANAIVDGNFNMTINQYREGAFSKLSVAFGNMKSVIRNNTSELNKEKKFLVDLLSDISHQLKTPLSSMIVYNDIMLNKEISKEQRQKFLTNNEVQLHRMRWLIQSILKLAKIDAKAIEFNKEDASLEETIYDAIETLEESARTNNVRVEFEEHEDINMYHDVLWIQEALINIIKNGIEHTNGGGSIYIKLLQNPIYKRIVVEDTGNGISEEDLPHIFKRFYKAKTNKKSESIGIGLALSKSIVEEHNGIIEVESEVGKGSRFIITFYNY